MTLKQLQLASDKLSTCLPNTFYKKNCLRLEIALINYFATIICSLNFLTANDTKNVYVFIQKTGSFTLKNNFDKSIIVLMIKNKFNKKLISKFIKLILFLTLSLTQSIT